MYKVVIIDDEPIIVEGISRLIPWGKYQCCVSACADVYKRQLLHRLLCIM